MTFGAIILILLIAAVLAFLVRQSPIPEPYKSWILWLVLCAAVLYILLGVVGHPRFLDQRIGT